MWDAFTKAYNDIGPSLALSLPHPMRVVQDLDLNKFSINQEIKIRG